VLASVLLFGWCGCSWCSLGVWVVCDILRLHFVIFRLNVLGLDVCCGVWVCDIVMLVCRKVDWFRDWWCCGGALCLSFGWGGILLSGWWSSWVCCLVVLRRVWL